MMSSSCRGRTEDIALPSTRSTSNSNIHDLSTLEREIPSRCLRSSLVVIPCLRI